MIRTLLTNSTDQCETGRAKRATDERVLLHLVFFIAAMNAIWDVTRLANNIGLDEGRWKSRESGVGGKGSSQLVIFPLIKSIFAGKTVGF